MTNPPSGCVCVDGRFCAPGEAVVSVFDTGFLLGDGVFESLRAVDGVPYLLDRHLLRLYSAAAALEFANMPAMDALEEQVRETLRRSALADAYVRVTVTRGAGGIGLAASAGAPTVVIAALPAPARAPAEHGIEATLLERRSEERVAAKSTSWQKAVVDRRRVEREGAGEGIYVTASGRVLEGVSSNVFVVAGDRLLTPPSRECLPGVTRARLLELAPGVGVTAVETAIELEQLMRAQEVFVTNAVQGLRRVCALVGTAIGIPRTDGVFAALRQRYEEDRASAVEAAVAGAAAAVETAG